MSKKTTNPDTSGDPIQTQDNVSTLYTAHRVHTLAQILFQQIAAWQRGASWIPPAAAVLPQFREMPAYGMGGSAPNPTLHGSGLPQGAGPALFYWYP